MSGCGSCWHVERDDDAGQCRKAKEECDIVLSTKNGSYIGTLDYKHDRGSGSKAEPQRMCGGRCDVRQVGSTGEDTSMPP